MAAAVEPVTVVSGVLNTQQASARIKALIRPCTHFPDVTDVFEDIWLIVLLMALDIKPFSNAGQKTARFVCQSTEHKRPDY